MVVKFLFHSKGKNDCVKQLNYYEERKRVHTELFVPS